MGGPLPFTSLDSATTPVVGAAKDLEGVFSTHGMVTTVTGSPSDWNVRLEGSHDGSRWVDIGGVTHGGNPNYRATIINQPVRFVRARLSSISGGTSPEISVTVASV